MVIFSFCHTSWTLLTFMLRVQAFRLSIWSFQRKTFRYTKFRIRKRAHTVGRVTKYLLLSVHCTQTTTLMFACVCVCGVCGYPHICPLQPAPMWRLKEKGEIAPSPSKKTPPANRLQAINSLIDSFLPSCPLTPIKAAGLPAPSPFLHCLKSTHTHQRHKLTPCLQTSMGDGYWKPVTNLRNIWKCWVRNFHFCLDFFLFGDILVLCYGVMWQLGQVPQETKSSNFMLSWSSCERCSCVLLFDLMWSECTEVFLRLFHHRGPWYQTQKNIQILKLYLVCLEWFVIMDRHLNFTHRSNWNLAHYLFTWKCDLSDVI